MSLIITQSAEKQISSLCAQTGSMVRLAIRSGGCQGFSKSWDITGIQDDDDTVYDFVNGKLLIDAVSMDIIQGSTIDYKTDLGGSYFTVDIPGATSTCGCGTSFSI
jgi:iron-sulfur cluster assembly accessory protein